jgi:hypothetical protein
MVTTQRREVAIGWDNIKKKKQPIGTNYPAMRARGFGKIVEPKFVSKDYIPPEYSTPYAKERSKLQEESDRRYGNRNESGFKKAISKIKSILKI